MQGAVAHEHRPHLPALPALADTLGDGPDQRRRLAQVAGPLGGRDDECVGPIGLEAEVEQPQRLGDDGRLEVVLHRHHTVVHLRCRVGVGPFPAGDGDASELLVGGAVLGHVALGDEGEELTGRDQAPGQEELVPRLLPADPGLPGGRCAGAEPPARAPVQRAEDDDGGGLAAEDRPDRLGDHAGRGDAAGTDGRGVGEVLEAERLGQVRVGHEVGVAADDAVDVVRREPGVGERVERRRRREGQLGDPRVLRELGGADAGDRAPVAMVVAGRSVHVVPLMCSSLPFRGGVCDTARRAAP